MKKVANSKSFHESIAPALTFGHFFAMLPVDGNLSKSEDNLRFRWTSIKTIYSIIFLILGSIESCLATRRFIIAGFSIGFGEAYLFYAFSMVRSLMIFRLAMKWKNIMKYWRKQEDVFLHHPYETIGWSLKWKLTVIFGAMVICVFIEHMFFLAYAVHSNYLQIQYCNPKSKIFWDNFLWRYRPHVRYFIKYSAWQLPIYEWVNLLQAFAFSYTDIFIMILSIGINTRFNQYNQLFRKIITNKLILNKPIIWEDLRVHYIQLIELTKFIDSHISGLVLISTSHNMLTLILKFFYAFKPTRIDHLDNIYFWFFMCFLLTRTMASIYLPALINDSAYKPLEFIRLIRNKDWSLDVKRLFDTVLVEAPNVAFSGMQFFYITKRMILSMIATIITFEIMLLDEVEPKPLHLCDTID